MPNATVRANAPAMPRRLFLAAGPAAVVFAALHESAEPATAGPSSDARLFELVEEGKRWWAEIGSRGRLCDEVVAKAEGRQVSEQDEAERDEAFEKYQDAFDEAMSTTPQTVAGIRALLEWMDRDCDGLNLSDEHVHTFVAAMLASPVLKAEA